MKKLVFIINSRIKHKQARLRSLKETADRYKGFQFDYIETQSPGDGIAIAKKYTEEGYDFIISVGGDGTINEVINGVLATDANKEVTIGILPCGTANDFCKSVRTPTSISEILRTAEADSFERLNIGRLQFQIAEGKQQTRHFINIADLGIGAEVVQRVNKSNKNRNPNLIFMSAIIRTFFTYKNLPVKIKADDWDWAGKANSLVIANGKYFGSGLCIAPNADPTSNQFEVVIIGDISIFDYLKNIRKLKAGKRIDHPAVFYKTTTSLEISSPVHCGLEADGEFLGYTPVMVRLDNRKIRILKKAN